MNRLRTPNLLIKAVLLLVCLVATATAQVYETTDKEGNPSFSDEASPDATEIELQQTNTVEPPSPGPAPAASQTSPAATERQDTQVNFDEDEQVETINPYIENQDDYDNDDRRDNENHPDRLEHLPVDPAAKPLNRPEREAIRRE